MTDPESAPSSESQEGQEPPGDTGVTMEEAVALASRLQAEAQQK